MNVDAVHRFSRENRPHDVAVQDLTVAGLVEAIDTVEPVTIAIQQVLRDGVPEDVVFTAIRTYERGRDLWFNRGFATSEDENVSES